MWRSQPVSQQIKSLEEELGVSLLHRTKRSVKLTAAGNAFLSEAKEILAHAELSKQIARRAPWRNRVARYRLRQCVGVRLPAGIDPVIPQKISRRARAFV